MKDSKYKLTSVWLIVIILFLTLLNNQITWTNNKAVGRQVVTTQRYKLWPNNFSRPSTNHLPITIPTLLYSFLIYTKIFLTKLYKNNSSIKNKKMKSIRLSRFIHLLECTLADFPSQKDDVEILYHCVVSTLLNDKNFYDEEGIFLCNNFRLWAGLLHGCGNS